MSDDYVVERIQIDADTRIVVMYDDDYQIEADERELTPEQVQEEIDLIELNGVYGVGIERRQVWTRENEEHVIVDVKYEWDMEDSIWGCFLDDTYTAEVVAEEYFGVVKTKEA